jgi:hypothetical protein
LEVRAPEFRDKGVDYKAHEEFTPLFRHHRLNTPRSHPVGSLRMITSMYITSRGEGQLMHCNQMVPRVGTRPTFR